MRIFVNEYTKIAAYAFLGIIFSYASFYLIANIYHYQEIRKEVVINTKEMDSYVKTKHNLERIKRNNAINVDSYNGGIDSFWLLNLQSALTDCYDSMNNDVFKSLEKKQAINVKNVEALRQTLVNDVVNSCLIGNLYSVTSQDSKYTFLENDNKYIKSEIDSINKRTDFINRQLNNNSSLYFNTEFATKNVYNDVDDTFQYLLDIYKDSSNLLLEISNKYQEEVSSNV